MSRSPSRNLPRNLSPKGGVVDMRTTEWLVAAELAMVMVLWSGGLGVLIYQVLSP